MVLTEKSLVARNADRGRNQNRKPWREARFMRLNIVRRTLKPLLPNTHWPANGWIESILFSLRGATSVSMVQAADFGNRNNFTFTFDCTRIWRIFSK